MKLKKKGNQICAKIFTFSYFKIKIFKILQAHKIKMRKYKHANIIKYHIIKIYEAITSKVKYLSEKTFSKNFN